MSYDGTQGKEYSLTHQEAMKYIVDQMISPQQKQQIATLMQRGLTMRKAKRAIGFTKRNPVINRLKNGK